MSSSKPSPSSSFGPAYAGNAALPSTKPTAPAAPSTSSSPAPSEPAAPQTGKIQLPPVDKGPQTNYNQFVDGTIVYNNGGNTVSREPYVSARPTETNTQPKALLVLPTADGKGFEVRDIDAVTEETLASIPRSNITYYKQQLKDYYPSLSDWQKSMKAGPVTDKDTGLIAAIKKSLIATSLDNFNTGKQIAELTTAKKTIPSTLKMYDFQSFVATRSPLTPPQSTSDRSSGLTTQQDAYAEFDRTVNQYVGDPTLVDKVDKLREAYWQQLHKTELARQSTSVSTVDPITGNRTGTTTAYQQLSEQDRTDMRLNLIVNGNTKAESKGITGATQEQLQDAGGVIGSAYGKLTAHAADYGINLTHEDLLNRVNKSLKPGGAVAGLSQGALDSGLTEQMNSITQAAKVHYKALAPYIDQGLKVSDIASNFQRLKEDEFGLVKNSVNVYDDSVYKAISGDKVMGTNDYIALLRSDPAWRKTAKANEMAAQFVNTLLKTWGKAG
jgi:hypothetical protein